MAINETTTARTDWVEPPQRAVQIDPEALMKINSLELRARSVVEGFMAGLHRSPYHGFSVEFTDYRPYSVGDDLRYLDWRLLARSDRQYIKRFEDETNLRCYIVMDNSRSMQFGYERITKAEYAKTIAATLSYFLLHQRDAVGVVTFDEVIQELVPPRFRVGQFRRLLAALDRSPAGKGTDISAPLEQLAGSFRKRGMIILVSDFLTSVPVLERHIAYLKAQRHQIMVIRVLDPQETTFDFQDARYFVDLETGRELYVDPVVAKKNYLAKFAIHANAIAETCRKYGARYLTVETNEPLDRVLIEMIRAKQNTTVANSAIEKSVGRPA